MAWFKSKQERFYANLREEQVFELVAFEVANNQLRPGLWAKAFAEADGNERTAQARYITLRAEQVKLGVDVAEELIQRFKADGLPTASEPAPTTEHPVGSSPIRRGQAFHVDEDKLRQALKERRR